MSDGLLCLWQKKRIMTLQGNCFLWDEETPTYHPAVFILGKFEQSQATTDKEKAVALQETQEDRGLYTKSLWGSIIPGAPARNFEMPAMLPIR